MAAVFGDLGLALIAILLVVLNAFFVLAEFAIVKVRATRLEELAATGNVNAKLARQVIGRLDAYLSATQLGITLASLALGWVGEPAFSGILESLIGGPGWLSESAVHGTALTLAFLFITFLHILVGELAPKSIAIRHPLASALFCARPLRLFERIFVIPLTVMNGASRLLLRAVGVPAAGEAEMTYSEEELRSILGASQERGGFSFHHLLLLENAFDFGERKVKDVAVPLDRVVFLDASRSWAENAAVVQERRLSRYPVRDGPRGKILGFVHVKTILLDLLAGRTPDVRKGCNRLPRASGEVLLEVALRKLQKSGEHMGVATDAEGEDVGIFTLEDVVEELIGDVRDEFEPPQVVSLYDVLPSDAVLLDPPAESRRDVVAALVERACAGAEGIDPAAVLDAVLRRDKAVPAAISDGVAIPHARIPGLKAPHAALARMSEGVDFSAPDGLPVHIAVLILTPLEAAVGVQARYLQRIVGIMQSDYLRARLIDALSPAEVREIIRIGETSASE